MRLLHFSLLAFFITCFFIGGLNYKIDRIQESLWRKRQLQNSLNAATDLTGSLWSRRFLPDTLTDEGDANDLYQAFCRMLTMQLNIEALDGLLYFGVFTEDRVWFYQKETGVYEQDLKSISVPVSKIIKEYTENNTYAGQFDTDLLFLPEQDDPIWAMSVDPPFLISCYADILNPVDGRFRTYLSISKLTKRNAYWITREEEGALYHKEECKLLAPERIIDYFYSRKECAQNGANPCPNCLP